MPILIESLLWHGWAFAIVMHKFYMHRIINGTDIMPTTIQIKVATRERLKRFGHKGESYDDIIDRLMDYFEELDMERLIEERWKRLQREKGDYIPLDKV